MNGFLLYTDASLIPLSAKGGVGILILTFQGTEVGRAATPIDARRSCIVRAELMGLLAGLARLPESCDVIASIDCAPVIETACLAQICSVADARTRSVFHPSSRPGRRERKLSLALERDGDLWYALRQETRLRHVTLRWVKGHGSDVHNAQVDRLAESAARMWNLSRSRPR